MTHFMRTISVKARLAIGIGILLLFIVTAGTGGLLGMQSISQAFTRVYATDVRPLDTLRTLNNTLSIDLVLTLDQLLYDEITFTEAESRFERIAGVLVATWKDLLAVQDASAHAVSDDWLNDFRPYHAKTLALLKELRLALRARELDRIDDLDDKVLTPLAAEYRKYTDALSRDRMESAGLQMEQALKKYRSSRTAFFLTICLSLIVGLGVGFLLIRSINLPLSRLASAMEDIMHGDLTRRLAEERQDEFGVVINGFNQMVSYLEDLVRQIQQSGIQVSSSITEIAATTKEQEATASEHAATTNEIAASATEIAATSQNLLQTMKRINSLARNTAYATNEGQEGLKAIDAIMVKMEEATRGIVDKLSVLNDKAANVAMVVKTINKVADQTNLLSLNAAIEAEKAGEHGAGFAVVATEIRRLADQTSVATLDIEQMVQDVQAAVSASVMGIDKFAEDVRRSIAEIHDSGAKLAHVIEQVEVLMPQVEAMNEGVEAQSLGARQISDAISQLNEAAQQTAESLAQHSAVIAQLQEAARGLQNAISRFTIAAT